MSTASPAPAASDARSEQRTVAELVSVALTGDEDDQNAWAAIEALQRRGDGPVFAAATKLLGSPSPKERSRGVDILGQLGTPNPPEALRTRCADSVLATLATEQSAPVLHSIGVALSHLKDPRAVAALLPLIGHDDAQVRLGVVHGLLTHTDPAAVEGLIRLSGDADEDVRNWATFGLGSMTGVDSPALRDALVHRLDDPNTETRGEALVGLAERKDERVLEPLRRALDGEEVGVLAVMAAQALGDPSLLPLLEQRRSSMAAEASYLRTVLDGAIDALKVRGETPDTRTLPGATPPRLA